MSRPGARYGRLKCGAAASWFRLETRFGKGPGWVIPHTGVQKLKVQVRAGGVAGLPHGAQALPRLNLLTLADKQVLQMGIDRFIPAGVQQTDIIAIARMIPGYTHHPACGSINRCTLHSGKIRTGMELLCFALHGINAGSVSGGFNSRFARQRILEVNGAYEVHLPAGGVDLVFSYVGYEDVPMPIVISKGVAETMIKDAYTFSQEYVEKNVLIKGIVG